MFLVGFVIPDNGKSAEEITEFMYPLMTLVFYWLEKLKRFRLSKEVIHIGKMYDFEFYSCVRSIVLIRGNFRRVK